MRDSRDGADNATIALARFHLNHSIRATSRQVALDGDDSEWAESDEALFVGSRCQAQATLRCSADAENLYRWRSSDESSSSTDFAYILLSPDNDTEKPFGQISPNPFRI